MAISSGAILSRWDNESRTCKFNPHGKQEYPPMHTVEHIINGAMVKLFGTGRSLNAHIERKKSRMDFRLKRMSLMKTCKYYRMR